MDHLERRLVSELGVVEMGMVAGGVSESGWKEGVVETKWSIYEEKRGLLGEM